MIGNQPKAQGIGRLKKDEVMKMVEDDLETVTKFLCDVVKENDLDLVYMSLKSLSRAAHESASQAWIQSYNRIVESVQAVMVNTHEKKLHTSFGL